MNKTLKKQLMIFSARAAVVILLSALINGYLINRIRTQQDAIETKKLVIAELSFQEDKLAELKKEFDDVVGALFILEDSLLPRLDPRPFKNKVLAFAEETGNKAEISLAGETAAKSVYPAIYTASFTLQLEGTLDSIYAFLDGIKTFDHFVIISSLSLTGDPDLNSNTKANLTANIYLK